MKIDIAWIDKKVALELDGRHTSSSFCKDWQGGKGKKWFKGMAAKKTVKKGGRVYSKT